MSHSIRWRRVLVVVLPLMALVMAGCTAFPIIPEFSYQGRLLDDSGSPVPDGDYEMTYLIYHAFSGGTEVYSQTATIPVQDGLFTTSIGPSVDMNPEIFAQPAWMEVQVEGETLTPRQRLQGAPFAFSLSPGALVRGTITRVRTFLTFDDTGAILTVWNQDASATGGHAILALNQAAAPEPDRGVTSALIAIAAGGDTADSTGSYGAIVRSENYRGLYARSSAIGYYAAVFDSLDGIQITGGGNCTGCALAYFGQNAGQAAIAPGDFVVVTGVELDAELNVPIMQVRKAQAGDTAIIGVATGAATRSPVSEEFGAQVGGFDVPGGSAASGSYVSIIVQGLVQANVGDASGLEMGQSLDGAGARPATGRLMSAPESGKAWVMLGGQ